MEKTAKAPKAPKVKKEKVAKAPGKRGRPIMKDSARQKRLARFEKIKAEGGEVKRGRPAGPKKEKAPKVKKEKVAKVPKTKAIETPVAETVAAE